MYRQVDIRYAGNIKTLSKRALFRKLIENRLYDSRFLISLAAIQSHDMRLLNLLIMIATSYKTKKFLMTVFCMMSAASLKKLQTASYQEMCYQVAAENSSREQLWDVRIRFR